MPSWLRASSLVLMVVVVYLPVRHAGFVWDDSYHTVEGNPALRDLAGLKRIWFESSKEHIPQYYPLVHTTFWLEYQVWGLEPLSYHVINVLLHAGNVLLLWVLLRRLGVPGAFFAAALFAVHPVEVESVAWVSERKNTLSTLCYLGSFLALLRFWPAAPSASAETVRRTGAWGWYALALLLFVAALLSKSVTCSLPAAFLVVRGGSKGGLRFSTYWSPCLSSCWDWDWEC